MASDLPGSLHAFQSLPVLALIGSVGPPTVEYPGEATFFFFLSKHGCGGAAPRWGFQESGRGLGVLLRVSALLPS